MTRQNSIELSPAWQNLCRDKEALQNYITEKLARHKPDRYLYKDPQGAVPAAVLIPLFFKHGSAHILFTKRSENLSQHKGQISFPGGGVDAADNSLKAAALRETREEVGLNEHDVRILGQTDVFLTNSDYIVTPFAGMIPHPYVYRINAAEIDRLIEVPLELLLTDSNFFIKQRKHKGYLWHIHYYTYKQDVIWGVTGFLLSNFLSIVFGLNRVTRP